MQETVQRVIAEFGEIIAITGVNSTADRFSALAIVASSGTLHLRCDDDTDQIILDAPTHQLDYPDVTYKPLVDLIGMRIEYAWTLKNHRGFVDGFQIRVVSGDREETRQFEVGAAAMDIREVV